MKRLAILLAIATTGAAQAAPPTQSLRPVARGGDAVAEAPAPAETAAPAPVAQTAPQVAPPVRPAAKPAAPTPAPAATDAPAASASAAAPRTALRPRVRPGGLAPEPEAAPAPAPEAVAEAAPEARGSTVQDVGVAPDTAERPNTVLGMLGLETATDGPSPAPPPTEANAPTPEDLGVQPEAEPKDNTLMALLRPRTRTRNVEDNAKRVETGRTGQKICGDPSIQGIFVGKVSSSNSACGLDEAVRVSSVSGISLSTHAVMDCTTARALNAWVGQAARPALKGYGDGLVQLRVAAHYACRTRNNQRGARISEHGKGHAIDIAGFRLRNGQEVTVLNHWSDPKLGPVLQALHRSACGPFGTVLGPKSDRFHQDHFHFDTARYRSGTYCR
ncbi:extensin family protein [Pseudooceanicola sp. LIPI14-2-Ac024]|uniref:extensin-like domain-containing protein n=1 Tax=Pseudooceanicola sp. LIPI14-2-Ac024 TaxID=3344875 RepID=UPI0035CF16A2